MTFPPRPLDASENLGFAPRPIIEDTSPARLAHTPRFAQLTYSSFDDGTGIGGGWQIKETAGNLSDNESESLKYWVHTTFDLVTPLPQFPTPEDIENFPRRLMYTALENGRAGYWHTAPAGADGSGRPGNVFAHAVLDRHVAAVDVDLRPIELWRSADWLTPYGAGDVSTAHLSADAFPRAGEAVSRATVVEFLCDPNVWRLGILSVLLDAVAAALDGGPTIVLAASSPDSAALWIGAISYLTSPGVSRTINWSTFDRGSGIATTITRGVHVISVPPADLASMTPTDAVVVLSEDEVPAMGDLGGAPHRTAAGSSVAVTEWSVIAQGILIDAETAHAAMAATDRVSAELGDVGLHPMLPLALTVAVSPELHDDVGDEAAAVIARYSPERLSRRAGLVGPASELIDRTLGVSAADCWHRLEGVRPDRDGAYTVAVELILAVYVERSLRDIDWLLQARGVPFLSSPPREGWMPNRLKKQVDGVVADLFVRARSAEVPSFDLAFESLRIADLLIRASCAGSVSARTPRPSAASPFEPESSYEFTTMEIFEEIGERHIVPYLRSMDHADHFVSAFGELNIATSTALIQPLLATSGVLDEGTIGRRVNPVVLEWVLPHNLVPLSARVILEPTERESQPFVLLLAEYAATKISDPIVGKRWARFNLLVLWRVLDQLDNVAVSPPELGPIFTVRFDIDALSALIRPYPGAIPPRYFLISLASEPLGDGLRSLAETVEAGRLTGGNALATPHQLDDLVLALASIRLRPGSTAMNSMTRKRIQNRAFLPLLAEVLRFGASNLEPELVRTLAVFGMSYILTSMSATDGLEQVKMIVRAAESADRPALVAEFASWVRPEDVDVRWVVESAILGSDEAPEKRSATVSERFLCSLTAVVDDRPVSLLDAVIDYLVEKNTYDGPVDLDAVEDTYRKRVSNAHGRGTDKALGQYRKFTKKWLDERGLGAGGLMSRLRRKP